MCAQSSVEDLSNLIDQPQDLAAEAGRRGLELVLGYWAVKSTCDLAEVQRCDV